MLLHRLFGLLLVGVGVYAIIDKWSSGEGFKLENVFDVIFNLASDRLVFRPFGATSINNAE